MDAITGFTLLAMGMLARRRRPRYAIAWILAAASISWFAGTIASWAVFLHRGPLAQLILTYPATRGWPSARGERVAVTVAYVYALGAAAAQISLVTIPLAAGMGALAVWRFGVQRGPERRPRAAAIAAAIAFALVLITGASLRLSGAGGGTSLLFAYETVVVGIAVGLTVDLVWGRWTEGLLATFVVDLGEGVVAGTLRDRLARTLGDPTLTVGFWVPDQSIYVDESGQQLALPEHDPGRAVRLIDEAGAPLVALVHDVAILNDPSLLEDVAAATRLAVANARLQAEVRSRIAAVRASRQRLVEAADQQRRQLERELRDGAEQRLTTVAELLHGGGAQLADLSDELEAARSQLHELAHGLHPPTLTTSGLCSALTELAARSPIPVEVSVPERRWPPASEVAAYFICSEALANAAKHADASNVRVRVADEGGRMVIEVADDGSGGADPGLGSGLRGLTDRVQALDGQLTIDSRPGRGTRLRAQLPILAEPSQNQG
jgi:signal transduction histidine kinase